MKWLNEKVDLIVDSAARAAAQLSVVAAVVWLFDLLSGGALVDALLSTELTGIQLMAAAFFGAFLAR